MVHRPGRLKGMADALTRAGAATGSGASHVQRTAICASAAVDALLQQWHDTDGARGVHCRALRRHALEELTASLTEAANDVALDHGILLRDYPAVVTPDHARHAADTVVPAGNYVHQQCALCERSPR